jgi:hypothetical protein
MPATDKVCPECKGTLEAGFVVDVAHGRRLVQRWVAGLPKSSFWGGLKTSDRECREVVSWRCADCGLLREYAKRKVPAPGPFTS